MNAYNFTERVRRALQRARDEALALRHEYVGTEHLLLALCVRERDVGEGVATAALDRLGVDLEAVRETVLKLVKPGHGTAAGPDLPYTSRAKRALELAVSEARRLQHSYVGTEHLLLGLVAEERGIGAQSLHAHGVSLPRLDETILALLGTDGPGAVAPSNRPAESVPLVVTVLVEHGEGRLEARKFRTAREAAQFLLHLDA